MITLYQFGRGWQLANISPFCMKLETYLQLADLPYKIIALQDPRKSPSGKLPYVEIDGEALCDSDVIITRLRQLFPEQDIDAHLTPEQEGTGRLLQRCFDEHLFWTLVYCRWQEEAGWTKVKADFFGNLPVFLRCFIACKMRKKVLAALRSQGTTLHTAEQLYRLAEQDLRAFSQVLGEKNFFVGDKPTSYDACAYSYLANFLRQPIATPLQDFISQQPALVAYIERMDALLNFDSLKYDKI